MPAENLRQPTPARVVAAGICALVLTVGVARFAYTPLLPVMRDEAGLGAIAAGWLATIGYVGYLAGALFASALPDLRVKWVLFRAGLIVAVASTFAMALTRDVPAWLILRLVAGWAGTAGILLGSGLVLNWLILHDRKPELGLHFAGVGGGIVLSGLIAAAMDGRVGWAGQWLVFGFLGLGFLVPAWLWLPRPTAGHHATPVAAEDRPSRRWMAMFALAYFCAGIGYVVVATYIVALVRDTGAISGDWVWVVIGLFAAPSCMAWDRIAARVGRVEALTLVYAIQTASIVLLALGRGPAAILLGAALQGASVMGAVSLTLAIVGLMMPHNPARAMARLTLAYGLAQIVGPAAAAYVAGPQGHYRGVLLIAAAIGLAGTLVSLACCPSRRPKSRAPETFNRTLSPTRRAKR